jgi:DNA-binding transcriptional LysR family regulator
MGLDNELSTEIHIEHCSGITVSLVKRVVDGTLHAAFSDLSTSHPALLARKLIEEPVVVYLPKSHPLTMKPLIRIEDLNNVPMIAVAREAAPSENDQVEEYFAMSGVRLKIIADAFRSAGGMSMVEQNVGVCLLSASAVRNSSVVSKHLSSKTLTRKGWALPARGQFASGVTSICRPRIVKGGTKI